MEKVTIMLVCSAGMSTSLIVTKMQSAAEKKGIEADIFAIPVSETDEKLSQKDIDVVLLGPQVRFLEREISKKLEPKNIPFDIINMQDYGMMNGENILETALSMIN